MTTQDVEKIIKIFEGANISTLDLEIDNIKIKLEKKEPEIRVVGSLPQAEVASTEAMDEGQLVTAPLVGTYYKAPSTDSPAFVNVGDKVAKGDKLCIIEAMKVMNEITAPCDGVIKAIYMENEKMVEFGQKLFLIGEE